MIQNLPRRRAAKTVASGDVSRQIKYEYPAGRVSGSRTPFLHRKFEERNFSDRPAARRRGFRQVRNEAVFSVSARKLGAALWQLSAEITATSASGVKVPFFKYIFFSPAFCDFFWFLGILGEEILTFDISFSLLVDSMLYITHYFF